MPSGLWIREGAPLPLPGASRLTRGQSPCARSTPPPSPRSAWRALSHLRTLSLPREPRRMGAPESLSPGLTARPSPATSSPPERENIPAGPGRAGGGSGASPLKSAARPAPRIPRHPLPASGVTLDFLTCREHCPPAHSALTVRTPGPGGPAAPQSPPSLPLRASHVTGLRPRRDLREPHRPRAKNRRRAHDAETGESAARRGAGGNVSGAGFPRSSTREKAEGNGATPASGKVPRSPGALPAGAGRTESNGCSLRLPGRGRAPAGIPGEKDMQSWRKSPGGMRPSSLYRGER